MTIVVFKVSEDPSLKEEMEKEVKIDFFIRNILALNLQNIGNQKFLNRILYPTCENFWALKTDNYNPWLILTNLCNPFVLCNPNLKTDKLQHKSSI